MAFINFNGKIISADVPVIQADNRGFRYGDGLFETLKYKLDKEVFNHFKITKTVIFHISQYNENNEGF